MSTASETVLQAVRALLVAVGGVTAAKVIPAEEKGPRPAKPYWTVKVLAARTEDFGPAERVDGLSGSTPQARMQERREATVSVQGFGSGGEEPLDLLALGIDSPASLTAQATSGIAAIVLSGPSNITELVDTGWEPRTLLELRVRYAWVGTAANQVALATVTTDIDGNSVESDPDPLPIDQAVAVVYP